MFGIFGARSPEKQIFAAGGFSRFRCFRSFPAELSAPFLRSLALLSLLLLSLSPCCKICMAEWP